MDVRTIAATACVAELLAGCAHMPEVTMHYYQPKATVKVVVTQSADCDGSQQRVFVATSATATVSYSSDLKRPETFRLKSVDTGLADIDGTFTFSEDRRLKGISYTGTGQGETILKSGIGLASALLGVVGVAGGVKPEPVSECKTIAKVGGGKPVTLTYTVEVEPPYAAAREEEVKLDPSSHSLFVALENALPKLKLEVSAPTPLQPVASAPVGSGDVPLTLTNVGRVELLLRANGPQAATKAEVWKQTFIAPGPTTYALPVPKAAIFGKTGFTLALADSGVVTSVGYNSTSGASAAMNAGAALATEIKGSSDAERAAEVKGQADLIAQQQRLVRCQAKPEECE